MTLQLAHARRPENQKYGLVAFVIEELRLGFVEEYIHFLQKFIDKYIFQCC